MHDERDRTDHAVIIAGGGPTGLMLAADQRGVAERFLSQGTVMQVAEGSLWGMRGRLPV